MMLKVFANCPQGFRHVCFYSESRNMQLLGNRLMAQTLCSGKPKYLLLLWRKLVYSFMKEFLVLFFNQGMICTVYVLNSLRKFPFGSSFYRNTLDTIKNPVTRHRKEIAFKVTYPAKPLAPYPYL